MEEYLPRFIEEDIKRGLRSSGAVLVCGPKFCGKTTTSSLFAKSITKLNTDAAIHLAQMEPRNTLLGETPHLIDEWQTVPDIWNQVKNWIDENPGFGQFILTGSATPADKTRIHHSGAGRIAKVKMRPMSLYESKESTGAVSLAELFDNPEAQVYCTNTEHSLSDTAFMLCRGGWPLSLVSDREIALEVTNNYYNGLFEFEASDNEKISSKNPELMKMLMRSYARNISTQASYQTIIQDVISANNRSLSTKTFDDYVDVLEDLFIIDDVKAWNPNLRSKAVARTTPTRHFVDTSIACSSLGISPADLMRDLNTFGLFFEDMAVRDLRVYASALRGEVFHYRDSRGLECDAVIHLKDGRWGLIEIKLGGEKNINEGAANLLKLKSDIRPDFGTPSFLMVLTATGSGYRRPDGVVVVPINILR